MSERIGRLREFLAGQGLDAVIVSNPPNRSFLSGFFVHDDGPDESAGVLLVDRDRARFLTSVVNVPWAKAEVHPSVEVVDWGRPWPRKLGELLKDEGSRVVGIEENALTVAVFNGVREGLDGAGELRLVGEGVDLLRSRKDAEELALLARAIRITDEVFDAVSREARPGMTEKQLAARLDQAMRDAGTAGPAFGTIVASGPHAARPHHDPTDRAFAEGEPIIIDMGASLDGYAADLTRTIWVGEPTEQLKTVYNVVLAANEAAVAGIRAGMTGGEADALARSVIEAAGYGEAFTHSLGHGLGIKVHEAPSLRKTDEAPLELGQVVTIEPGIYLEGWGGVRIEDVVAIEPGGARVLTAARKHPAFA
ncbi:MAG: M24 family metallopeptidase [Chloroflexota bacterium]